MHALTPSAGLAGSYTLTEPPALLFCRPGKDCNEEIPHGPACVEPRLLVAHHSNASLAELLQVSGRRADALAGEAIERPDEERIELASMGAAEDRGKRRAIIPRAARSVGMHADDLEAKPIGPLPELA